MNRLTRLLNSSLLILTTLLVACGGGGYSPETGDRGEFVSAAAKGSYTAASLQSLTAQNYPVFNTFTPSIAHDVKTYVITYWTVDTDGEPVKASGLLAIPNNHDTSSTRLVGYHHGTVFHTADVPTNLPEFDVMSAILASMDFIVILPDYIGYGESVDRLHPYMHATSLANSSIDLMRAAGFFMSATDIPYSKQVLLGGYSEGGYAALATHKMIQAQHADEFDVIATYAGAGAYDLLGTAETLLGMDTLPYAPYVAFMFKAYDEIYGFNRISEIFNPAYVDTVNNYFYGNYHESVIEDKLTNDIASLLNSVFLADFRSSGETEIKARLTENNIYDWSPLAPVRLFHGIDDNIVPYANAETALQNMTPNGTEDVSIVDCVAVGPASHNNCYQPYLLAMVQYFLGL